jgi:hypothetical protein
VLQLGGCLKSKSGKGYLEHVISMGHSVRLHPPPNGVTCSKYPFLLPIKKPPTADILGNYRKIIRTNKTRVKRLSSSISLLTKVK